MIPDTAKKREILQTLTDAKTGYRFSLKSTQGGSPPLIRSASTPNVMKTNTSTDSSRSPLQHININPNSGGRGETPCAHQNVQRSQILKGASNLPKETRLLQKKLDFMLQGFQETVVEHDRSQQIRLRQLKVENEKLRKANNELEIENLTYFKELEDCEEHLDELEQQRKSLIEKMSKLRQDYAALTSLKEENEKLATHNASLLKELNEYTGGLHQKDCKVKEMQIEIQQLTNKLQANEKQSSSMGTKKEKEIHQTAECTDST
jgi:DNA repair exonuclease SbcCD ATPase subunit